MANDDDNVLKQLAGDLGEILRARTATVCAAESCTGGWLAKTLTDVPGSSDWFGYGLVTYSNEAKKDLLGVSDVALKSQGAVSRTVVEQMAQGAIQRAQADLAISVSGIAGPGGGSVSKPVGTVWFGVGTSEAFSRQGKHLFAHKYDFAGNREQVRRASVRQALLLLLEYARFSE